MRLEKHAFLDHLESRGAKLACPFCACESWNLLIENPDNLQDQRIMEFSLQRAAGRLAIATVVMVCANCGFLRQHLADKAISDGCMRR
ncbi:MAG: hypothetical protein JNN30_20045 [Rhodanobacteraceae bacterium]|nr:hypothetical protein [Rhodanobacteraceae bacterium]